MISRIVFLLTLTASTAALAGGDFAMLDADGSGGLSLAEVQAAYPDATAEEFATYDADASGELSESEFAAWTGGDAD